MKYILTVIYMILSSSGILLMKIGGDSLRFITKGQLGFSIGYVTLSGFLCYLLSFLLWQKILCLFNVSYIVPITAGIIQIITLILSIIFLKESFSVQSIVGVLVIIIGVVLITTASMGGK